MASKTAPLTTAHLRKTLFETIEHLKQQKIKANEAVAIAKLSEQIVKSADLEMRYTLHLDQLDSSENGLTAGPMLLTDKSDDV